MVMATRTATKKVLICEKKNNFSCAPHFFVHLLAVVLHDYKKLPIYMYYGGIVVCVPVHLYFHCCSFSP